MKQPRLPGAEKFKFSGQAKEHVCLDDSVTDKNDGIGEPSTNFSFIRGHPSYSSCPTSYCATFQGFARNDAKRRPLLPISSRKTSRVLNNTSAELNIDTIDVRGDSVVLPRGTSVVSGVSRPDSKFSRPTSAQSRRPTNCEFVPGSLSLQTKLSPQLSDSTSTHSGVYQSEASDYPASNLSSPRSSQAFLSPSHSTNSSPRSSQISQSSNERCQSPAHILPCTNPPFNWMNHRSSTIASWRSLSSRSSCASEEDIWVLRKVDV